MIPNPNIYGSSDDWIIAGTMGSNPDTGNKLAPWQTLGNAVLGWGSNPPVFSLNTPLDTSISFCGIGYDTEISKITAINMATGEELSTEEPFVTNWFLGYLDSPYSVSRFNYNNDLNYNDKVWIPIDSLGNTNVHRFIRPYVAIVPDDTVLLVIVEAADGNLSNTIQEDLQTYESTHKSTFPNITAIYVRPYKRGRSAALSRTRYAYNNTYYQPIMGRMIEYQAGAWGIVTDYWGNSQTSNTDLLCIWGIANKSPYYTNIGYHGEEYNIHHDNSRTVIYREYGEEWILSAVAALGLFFTKSENTALNGTLSSEGMYCGTIGTDGLTHGQYTRGIENLEQPQYTWTDSTESTYDPSNIPDNTKYNYISRYNTASIETFNTMYALSPQTAHKLAKVLSNALQSRPSDVSAGDWSIDTFFTNNPLDCILSLKKFPCTAPYNIFDTPSPVYFGAYSDNAVTGFIVNEPYKTYRFTFSRGTNNGFISVFGDSFLDYEPYTRATLYIPFCGTISIAPSDFLNHTINVDLVIDFITGACTAYIKRDEMVIHSAQGNCAIDIAISGLQSATLDSQIFQASQNLTAARDNSTFAKIGFFTNIAQSAGNLSSGGLSSVTGGLAGTVSGLQRLNSATLTEQKAEYDISHIDVPFKQVSAASPLTAQINEYCCRLTIYRPKIASGYNADIYAHTVGFATLENGIVGDYRGRLECANIDLSGVPCTLEEQNELRNIFAQGVYI